MASKKIYVFADWYGLNDPHLMGILLADRVQGNEVFSFEYDKMWLESGERYLLDPDLMNYSGPQYIAEEKVNFGIFLDSSPDRWGRVLMRRREALMARMSNRPQKNLMPSDFLLGVYDEHRMGALRFKESLDGPFVNDNREMTAPLWTSVRELEYASKKLEEDKSVDDPESTAYDINAVPSGTGLSLNISDEDNSLDLELVLEVAEFFRLSPNKAREIINRVQKNVSKWSSIATIYGLSRREQELMSLAFEQPHLSIHKGLR